MKEYTGHRSWNAWNVSCWLDEHYYNQIQNALHTELKKYPLMRAATRVTYRILGMLPPKTPDGAVYNALSVKTFVLDQANAIKDWETEQASLQANPELAARL